MDKMHLYKYRSFNKNTLAIFINCQLYFANVKSLNDPFDCQMQFFEGFESFLKIDYKYELLRNAKELQTTKIKCDKINQEMSNHGILSLSQVNNEILMWSHYSHNHEGICIGFNRIGLDSDFKSTKHPLHYHVMYDKPKPFAWLQKEYEKNNIEPFSHLEDDIVQILLKYKHENWKYEKEIRYVNENFGPVKFSPKTMKSVYFGINTPSQEKVLLNNIIRSNRKFAHLEQYQMVRKRGEFSITAEPLSKKYLFIDGDGES